MTSYVHGDTDSAEIARLEKQAQWTSDFSFPFFDASAGMRVLDLATGVGAMAAQLKRVFPGIELFGVDLSMNQLRAARTNHPEIPVLRADATRLPFASATFDRVHCTWLLEHVPDPVAILKEVRRVLKPGALCQFVEVDNASFSSVPPLENVTHGLRVLNAAQLLGGGDPFVGQRLHHLFRAAGFRRSVVQRAPLRGTSEEPRFLQRFIDEFAEIFDGLDKTVAPQHRVTMRAAAAELRSLASTENARLNYTAYIAHGLT